MSIPEQSGDSFDFCVLFRVYFTGKGAVRFLTVRNPRFKTTILTLVNIHSYYLTFWISPHC